VAFLVGGCPNHWPEIPGVWLTSAYESSPQSHAKSQANVAPAQSYALTALMEPLRCANGFWTGNATAPAQCLVRV